MGLFTINRTGCAIICYGMRALWQKKQPAHGLCRFICCEYLKWNLSACKEAIRGKWVRIGDLGNIVRRKNKVAGGPGFEPGLTESESVVLPLNYPPAELYVTRSGVERCL